MDCLPAALMSRYGILSYIPISRDGIDSASSRPVDWLGKVALWAAKRCVS